MIQVGLNLEGLNQFLTGHSIRTVWTISVEGYGRKEIPDSNSKMSLCFPIYKGLALLLFGDWSINWFNGNLFVFGLLLQNVLGNNI